MNEIASQFKILFWNLMEHNIIQFIFVNYYRFDIVKCECQKKYVFDKLIYRLARHVWHFAMHLGH